MNSARCRIGLMLCVLLLIAVAVVILRSPDKRSAKLHSPELEYLKAVNSVAPPRDPELMFILMGEFASPNLQDEGTEFFSARLKEFEPTVDAGSEVFVSGNHWPAAGSECIQSATAESLRLCQRHDCHPRPGKAGIRRAGLRRELDRTGGAYRTFRLLS
jgi:hypothetical protein